MKREQGVQIQLNWSQIITSLLVGAILGAFALVRLSDTQTVVIAGHTKTIELFRQHNENQITQFKSLEDTVNKMDRKLDQLLLGR